MSTIITELAVLDVTKKGLVIRELARETNLEEVRSKTGAPLLIPEEEITRF